MNKKFTINGVSMIGQPLITRGAVLPGYYVSKLGNIISTKRGTPIDRKWSISGGSPYPKLAIYGINVQVHRAVAEAFLALPKPSTVSKVAWDATPEETKNYIKTLTLVNHIDHDKTNYHIDNLEWATHSENAVARDIHYGTSAKKQHRCQQQISCYVGEGTSSLKEFFGEV